MPFKEILARRLITVVLVFGVVVGLGWAGRPDPEPIGCFAWERALAEMRSDRGGLTSPDDISLEAIEARLEGTRPLDCAPAPGPMSGRLSSECRAWRKAVRVEGRSYRSPQPEKMTIEGAAKALEDTRPEGCPLPTHL